MKHPEKLRIQNSDVSIKFVPSKDIDGAYAQFNCRTFEIEIADDLSRQQTAIASIHEILHVICRVNSLKYAYGFDDVQEEKIVRLMEVGLTSLIQQEPGYIKYLLTELK